MNFKGRIYESILDLEVMLMVNEANLKAERLSLKYALMVRDKDKQQSAEIKINLLTKLIEKLESIVKDLIEKIEEIVDELDNLEGKVFIQKFIHGKSNQKIIDELHISRTVFYRMTDSIDKQLLNTEYGRYIKKSLSTKE